MCRMSYSSYLDVFEIGSKWPYSCWFMVCSFQDLFKMACIILLLFPYSFFYMYFLSIHMVHLYRSIDTATTWKKSNFILSDRLDFHMIHNLSIEVLAFARCILKSLSVDEILLSGYLTLFTNFKALSLRVEVAPARLKHMYSIL